MGTLTALRESCLELVAPTRCAGCDFPGAVLCEGCRNDLGSIDRQWSCPKCGAPYGHIICTECIEDEWEFSSNFSLAEFNQITARMVTLHKDHGERRLASAIGELLVKAVKEEEILLGDTVTWIPATPQAYRRRGFDHAYEIARAVAKEIDLPVAQLLLRSKARDQRILGREGRAQNMRGSFSVANPPIVLGKRITIIDDVFTTGATMNEAAGVLRAAGAFEVSSLTFARVW